MWNPLVIGVCVLAILNLTVAIGCVLGTYCTHAEAIRLGGQPGIRVRGRVWMLIVTAVYGFFGVPIWIYNLVAKIQILYRVGGEQRSFYSRRRRIIECLIEWYCLFIIEDSHHGTIRTIQDA